MRTRGAMERRGSGRLGGRAGGRPGSSRPPASSQRYDSRGWRFRHEQQHGAVAAVTLMEKESLLACIGQCGAVRAHSAPSGIRQDRACVKKSRQPHVRRTHSAPLTFAAPQACVTPAPATMLPSGVVRVALCGCAIAPPAATHLASHSDCGGSGVSAWCVAINT